MENTSSSKIFISYSHKDEGYKDELLIFLSPLKQKGIIDYWEASQLVVGSHFDKTIIQKINQFDIFLLLVSPNSIASDYVMNIELKRALELNLANHITIVPVILRPCNWEILDIKKFHAAPKGGKAISLWSNKDEAFKKTVNQIEILAKKLNQVRLLFNKEMNQNPLQKKHSKKKKKPSAKQTAIYKKITTDTFINQVGKLKIDINKKKK